MTCVFTELLINYFPFYYYNLVNLAEVNTSTVAF